ncbi:hypothetical protein NSU18_10420 [Paenibacillus sp. FSL H8-0048]|uniref:hypothetical protein n=1 Tax=Paenibacillus sp. FSL H8-0048 TaxID=2954508 RepID=UPI0030F55376
MTARARQVKWQMDSRMRGQGPADGAVSGQVCRHGDPRPAGEQRAAWQTRVICVCLKQRTDG